MRRSLRITIQNVFDAGETLNGDPDGTRFPHVISMGDPDSTPPPGLDNRRSLRVLCHDIDWDTQGLEGLTYPAPEHGAAIIEFGREVISQARERNERQSVLLHCRAGISRSTAAALMLLYLDETREEVTIAVNRDAETNEPEERAAQRLLTERPKALPNRSLLRFADEQLGSGLSQVGEEIHKAWAEKVRGMLRDLR